MKKKKEKKVFTLRRLSSAMLFRSTCRDVQRWTWQYMDAVSPQANINNTIANQSLSKRRASIIHKSTRFAYLD